MSETNDVSKLFDSKTCLVKSCSNNSRPLRNPDLFFHTFPPPNGRLVYINDYFGNKRQVDQHTAWKTILKIKKVTKDSRICCKHFTKDDYFFPDVPSKRHKLRHKAIPTCNLPSFNEESIKRDNERLKRRVKRQSIVKTTSKDECEKNSSLPATTNVEFDNLAVHHNINLEYCKDKLDESTVIQANECVCNFIQSCKEKGIITGENTVDEKIFEEEGKSVTIQHDPSIMEPVPARSPSEDNNESGIDVTTRKLSSKDFGAQVNTKYRFLNLIKNKEQLSTATGIESFEILKVIVESVKLVSKYKYEKGCTMKTEDRVVMTYVKLKQSLSYSFLALIFDCITPMHCRTIFLETVRTLSKCLKEAIPWPSKEEISKNIPKCFVSFEDTRVVVDCTEIYIQRPKNLCCQILTYSHYKGAQTVKFMTGVTPGGNISFISKPYGGRASDSAIFQQSDLVKLLEPADGVMVDKGFLIEELCEKNQFKFIQPPFLKNKKKFSEQDSIHTAQIAKARVHVERSNQRIKAFKIVGSVMPVSLVPYIQDIFTVICGTVNLSAPIIGNDAFTHEEMDVT